jgi:long-subunit fatty acid transport protein
MKFLLFCVLPTLAAAQGFYWNTVSARSQGLGGVYLPSTAGALDALAANPAGLTAISAPTVDLSLSTVFSKGDFTNSVNTAAPLRNPTGLVPFAAFATPLGRSRFSVGAGVLPELLSVSDWRYVDAPGVAGASYGLQRQKSAIVAARTAFGVGFAVNKRLSIGATAGVVYNTNRLLAPYIFQSHPALAGLKTLLDLKTTGTGWNASLGVLARPVDRMQLSFAWKSRTVIESTGDATGNLQTQLNAIGLGGARPDFRYDAMVRNVLPQSVLAGVSLKAHRKWLVGLQANWIGWRGAFRSLPVTLTNGNNSDINGLLSSNGIFDRIPLDWKNQVSYRAGVEHQVAEGFLLRGGYSHGGSALPSSTLSPLTAAIMTRQFSTGFGYRYRRLRFDAAYTFTPLASQSVGSSALKNGEYANSRVRIGMQGLTLNTSYQF